MFLYALVKAYIDLNIYIIYPCANLIKTCVIHVQFLSYMLYILYFICVLILCLIVHCMS